MTATIVDAAYSQSLLYGLMPTSNNRQLSDETGKVSTLSSYSRKYFDRGAAKR